jgi:hypothetical protein
MNSSSNQLVHDLYILSIQELIECYTSELPVVVPDSSTRIGNQLATIVGFAEERMSGTSVLIANLEDTLSLAGDGTIDPMDWLGELNNQAMGRLKNKLVRHGVTVQLTTPVCTSGKSIGFTSTRSEPSQWAFRWTCGSLLGFLSLMIDPELELNLLEDETVATEGSLMMF